MLYRVDINSLFNPTVYRWVCLLITSDTHAKEIAISFDLGEHRVRIGGCVKGAGMISPSMATMLCFITTDASISSECLRKGVLECVEESFNRITIDGDMSTNDTVIVLANGASQMPVIRRNSSNCKLFRKALNWLMLELAKAVVRDGERVQYAASQGDYVIATCSASVPN